MIRVLIADESPVVTDNISRRLALEDDLVVCGTAADGESAVREGLWLRPDIAVIDAGLPGMDGVQTTELLAQCLPGTGVIMMSMEAENEAYRLAMLAGAREFLQKPFRGDELVAAVRRVHAFGQRRAGTGTPTAAELEPAAPIASSGAVTVVIAGKGGVGKTVLAINLAVALRAAQMRRVVLVDLSLQFGDVAAALALPTAHTLAELLPEQHTADAEMVRDALVAGPGDISVLLAPAAPEVSEYVTAVHLTTLVATLRRAFDHIVVDTPSYLTDTTMTAIRLADHVVLVTDLSVPGLKNTQLMRGVLETLSVAPARVIMVANHRESAGELDGGGAAKFLGAEIAVEVPFDPHLVAMSVNQGVPFAISDPDSAPTQAVTSIARTIDPVLHVASTGNLPGGRPERKKRPRRRLSLPR